jgi:hypothetical protein
MMLTVDQMLRAAAQTHQGTPYWVLEKDYALGKAACTAAKPCTLA